MDGMRFTPVAAPSTSRFSSPNPAPTLHPPTGEQQDIIDAYRDGMSDRTPIVIEALAGTGKTTTLKMLAAVNTSRQGVYMVYNKAMSKEATGQFPQRVQVGTAHSFAFQSIGRDYAHRLPGKGQSVRLRANQIATMLGVRATDVGGAKIAPALQVRLAAQMVDRFCTTGDYEFSTEHVPPRAEQLGPRPAMYSVLLPTAKRIWRDLLNPHGKLYFKHDHYLKFWQLAMPRLHGEYIAFDEAQDANPVIAEVVARQEHMQRIYVGDSNQQLYAWRGAVDALAQVDGAKRLALTKSFRFGPAIAEIANEYLALLGSAQRVVGHDPVQSRLARVEQPDALLARTNGGALGAILAYQERGVRVSMAPGDSTAGKDILSFAYGARDLQAGRETDHPDLCVFGSWADLLQHVEEEEDMELGRLVGIISRVGTGAVISAIRNLVPKERAEITVSTAHKSKGLEWNKVKVLDDFIPPDFEDEDAETDPAALMLNYVTCTRAKKLLDAGPLANPGDWIK